MSQTAAGSLARRMELARRWWWYRLRHPRRYRTLQRRRREMTADGYSCKPFDDTRSIFIHIPKCAGVAVARSLYGNLAGGHATLDDYLEIFEPAAMRHYFKFAIVRNPWDRLVSSFHFLRAGGFDALDRSWRHKHAGVLEDFTTFVDWLTPERIWQKEHLKPQYHYLIDRRRLVGLDFVALQENLADDFRTLVGRIGITARLSPLNRSLHLPYGHYYSDRTREKVAVLYREDIALLGYSYNNDLLPVQLRRRARLGGSLFCPAVFGRRLPHIGS